MQQEKRAQFVKYIVSGNGFRDTLGLCQLNVLMCSEGYWFDFNINMDWSQRTVRAQRGRKEDRGTLGFLTYSSWYVTKFSHVQCFHFVLQPKVTIRMTKKMTERMTKKIRMKNRMTTKMWRKSSTAKVFFPLLFSLWCFLRTLAFFPQFLYFAQQSDA